MAARGSIQLGLLGPLAAWRDGAALPLGGSKQRAVLAVLALESGRTVTTDTLIEALWPEQAPGRPQTAIQGYVSQLRKTLGPESIATEANGYRLDLAPEQLDSAEFERRLGAAPKLAPRRARGRACRGARALARSGPRGLRVRGLGAGRDRAARRAPARRPRGRGSTPNSSSAAAPSSSASSRRSSASTRCGSACAAS